MVNYLENLLQEKTKGKKDEVLFTQWQVAKEYVPQVLATISNIFPHYTLHDKSHSDAILANIGRILKKESFEKFSAIDIWLLLCSAFYHDIGMAAFASDLNKLLNENEFLTYMTEIQSDETHILNEQAKYFVIEDKKVCFKDNAVSLEKIEAIKFILAEYIRYTHSKRSEDVLKDEPSMYLPNNPIPQRLIKLLGRICESHTESFEKVMELPFAEMGLDYDECHPRYIACLLRLGDLLDLDNNRVSDIVLRTVTKIPTESFFHIKKHLSISHIQMNSKQIDITAECEDYKTADLASSWFSWLDSEITNQMKNWNKIVPSSDYGFLPTVGNLKVELKNYDTIDGKLHPKFEIDSKKAMEMLQGAGFYNEPYQSIREILQNAVDATYFRIWLDNKSKGTILSKDNFEAECKKDDYIIKISIKKDKALDNDKILWHISVADSGLGMSKEDLGFLCKTGSSSRNTEKQKMISEMPEWMKPSGIFGIGFQSIFLLTDKVHIKTRKYNREDVYDVDLYSPTGGDNGTVLVKTSYDSDFHAGTMLDFDFITKKLPNSFSVSSENDISNRLVRNYDFVESESFDFEIGLIYDEVIKFAQISSVKIELNDCGQKKIVNSETSIDFSYYSTKTNLAIDIYDIGMNSCTVFYRNQRVRRSPFIFNFLHIIVNILGENAKKALTLNRNEIRKSYMNILWESIIHTVFDYIRQNFSGMKPDWKIYASMFVLFYKNHIGDTDGFRDEILSAWENYSVQLKKAGKTKSIKLKELLERNDIVKVKRINGKIHSTIYKEYRGGLSIEFSAPSRDDIEFFYFIAPRFFSNISFVGDNNSEICLSKKKIQPLIINSAWKTWFRRVYLNNLVSRNIMPCNDEYSKLALKKDWLPPYIHYCGLPETFAFPKMICPYIINDNGELRQLVPSISQALIDMTYEHRADLSVSKEEIQQLYEIFVTDKNAIVNKINEELRKNKSIYFS